MNPGDPVVHETRRGEVAVTAFSICTDQACLATHEVPAVRTTISQMGHDVFSRTPMVETHHVTTDDSAYVCEKCGGPCIVSEKPPREVPSYGYAHPQSRAWAQAREARGA